MTEDEIEAATEVEAIYAGTRIDDFSTQPEARKVEILRAMVATHTANMLDGVLVDVFTASTILECYDALNEGNRAKFMRMEIFAMGILAYRLVARVRELP